METKAEKTEMTAHKTMTGNCPCGFKFETPHGEEDAVSVMQDHVRRIHPQEYPGGLSREEALKDIKEKM
jgi:hypothetical protein